MEDKKVERVYSNNVAMEVSTFDISFTFYA